MRHYLNGEQELLEKFYEDIKNNEDTLEYVLEKLVQQRKNKIRYTELFDMLPAEIKECAYAETRINDGVVEEKYKTSTPIDLFNTCFDWRDSQHGGFWYHMHAYLESPEETNPPIFKEGSP